ncbi:MAG: response regulator [Lachnospiraceae bacterium]|nr:response regulator [Lachnospiraceae bacterium]
MWVINCILIIIGTVAAIAGINYCIRYRDARGKIRFYILVCGLSSGLWCTGYALVGLTPDLTQCGTIRAFAVFGVCSFLATEILLVADLSGANQRLVRIAKGIAIAISIPDFIIYSANDMDIYIRVYGRNSWYANPDYTFNGTCHSVYMGLITLLLFIFWIIWIKNSKLKRLRNFLLMFLGANLLIFLFSIPDTFASAGGGHPVPTSGIGAALCAILLAYGATRLNLFDVRLGNIRDKVFDFLEAGILIFDMDHQIALLNHYARELVDEGTGKYPQIRDFFEIDPDMEKKMFEKARGDIYNLRLRGMKGNKTYSVSVRAVDDNYGELVCYMCAFMDITQEVDAATRLELASLAKSRFLAQMSHEIRTPINAILGMNEMILRRSEDQEILDYASNINSAGSTLLALINSILDFSKIEDGRMELVPVRYETASLINDLYHSIVQRADDKGLRFELQVDENLPRALVGDDVRFSQVIMNLLTNAVKYTEKGSVILSIRLLGKENGNARIFVSVRDTGIGIREEDRERLYISFERLDEVRNRSVEGTGLGISIVVNLLALMGSTLKVDSIYGVGSDFSFVIEQEIADDTPIGDYRNAVKTVEARKDDSDLISAPDARVLLVDDNWMNLKVAQNLMKLCGIKPDLAASGEQTIAAMREHEYDIVFLDHMMPQMDGIETLRLLEKEELIPANTTVIALTANAVVGAKEFYLSEGFDDYLSKPIEIKDLVEKLKAYLPSGSAGEDDGVPTSHPDKEDEGEDMETLESYDIEYLASCGVNVASGMSYCGNDQRIYFEILSEFISGIEPKLELLDRCLGEERWHDYEVEVHAIKSNTKALGFDQIMEEAGMLEAAANGQDADRVKACHAPFVKRLREILSMINNNKRDHMG